MTREIKFRGKRLDNGDWVYGDLLQFDGRPDKAIWPIDEDDWIESDPTTVGQFIGLRDKNRRDIYKGDIMTLGDAKNRTGVVVKSLRSPAFVLRVGDTEYDLYYGFNERKYEVLGNIHDNPEMWAK